MCATVFANGPDTSSMYKFDFPPGVNFEFTLKEASNGQYTVGGGLGSSLPVSGTLRKNKKGEYILSAKVRKAGSSDDGWPIDGRWDEKLNDLVIVRLGPKKYGNLGRPCIKEALPEYALTWDHVEIKNATEGDPKAWHYPTKVSGTTIAATFDYPGLATLSFDIDAPASISAKSGGELEVKVGVDASGKGSADSHINVWVSGLKLDQADVLEVKVNANESKSASRTYNLTVPNANAKEVTITVGLTWGGPKYTIFYKRKK